MDHRFLFLGVVLDAVPLMGWSLSNFLLGTFAPVVYLVFTGSSILATGFGLSVKGRMTQDKAEGLIFASFIIGFTSIFFAIFLTGFAYEDSVARCGGPSPALSEQTGCGALLQQATLVAALSLLLPVAPCLVLAASLLVLRKQSTLTRASP